MVFLSLDLSLTVRKLTYILNGFIFCSFKIRIKYNTMQIMHQRENTLCLQYIGCYGYYNFFNFHYTRTQTICTNFYFILE